MPSAQSFLTISRPCTAIFLASSATAMVSAIRTTRLCSAGVVICVCFSFLPAAATFFLGKLARALTAGTEAGATEAVAPGGRAVEQAAAAETPQLLVAVLDLDARACRLAARRRGRAAG